MFDELIKKNTSVGRTLKHQPDKYCLHRHAIKRETDSLMNFVQNDISPLSTVFSIEKARRGSCMFLILFSDRHR